MKKQASPVKNILNTLQTPNKPIYMQKWLWAVSAVVLLVILFMVFKPSGKLSPGAAATAGEYTVEITGTYAIGYEGQIISGPNVLDIKGIILKPVVYTVQGSPVTVNLMKPGQGGTVNVAIKRGNSVLKSGVATGPYAVLNLTATSYY